MESGKSYAILGYKVTGDSEVIDELFGINEEIKQVLISMYAKVEKKKNSTIKELLGLIEKYPHVPQFKNLLSVIYNKQGNHTKSYEVNHWLISEHPGYLFGKLNLANEYIFKEQYDKVPEILGELMEIKNLYPDRNEFHIDEVAAFYRTAIHYFIGIENLEAAESRLDVLKALNEEFEDELSDEIDKLEDSLSDIQLKNGLDRYQAQRENAREVEVIPVKVVEPTTEKPDFTNAVIEQLYCNSMRISHDLLKQILRLPRETLIPDLHKVVYDSMARFEYFADETKWHANTHEFIMHALYLLTELKSEESTDVLLDILRQDEEYLDYWFSDSLTEELWECLFVLGFNKLDKFKSFLFEPNHYCYARVIISEAVSQIALHYPERRNEIINWYREVINEILVRKDDENIIDTDWIGFIICDVLDIKVVELTLLVKKLFDEGLVTDDICGNCDEVITELKTGKDSYNRKRKAFDTIFSRYENILTSWHYYKDKSDLKQNDTEDNNGEDYENEDDRFDDYEEVEESLPILNPNKNIGRNDPCPCGSGKKYKKCCLKN